MADVPTSEHIRTVIAEIATCFEGSKYGPEAWKVRRIEYLTTIPGECYHVVFEQGGSAVFHRTAYGKLQGAGTWTYEAADNFEDKHKSKEQASAPESEASR